MILDDVTFGIDSEDKIGIVGINGTGKSTLLSIVAGLEETDEGQVIKGRDVRIAFLPQNPVFDDDKSILDNVAALIQGKEAHWDVSGEVRARLEEFGIPDVEARPSTLSGGQRKRAALIAAILTPCELLILDEPTNHLDSRMIEWLEEYLQDYRGALLMVTHDRYFLDRVTNQILEIDKGRAYRYKENYSGYLELKQQRQDYLLAAERKMAALYRQDLAWMMRGARARSTKQKAHIQRFEQLKNREKIIEERRIQLDSLPSRMGNKTIELEGIGKHYDDHVLFKDFTYRFLKNDRIGIVGPNGCGKSTLIKCIIGALQVDEGTVEIGQTIRIGYFSQESEELDENRRVLDYIKDTAEYIQTSEGMMTASVMCDRFLFNPEMQYAVIGKLSGGERRRLALLKVLMSSPNVLILDEPTNDLDIQTLQILEDYLDHFPGIILVVSHDRYFLDRVVSRIFAFQADGTLWQSEGGYTEYREHCTASGKDLLFSMTERMPEGVLSGKEDGGEEAKAQAASRSTWKRPAKKNKLSYKEQREYDGIEAEIDALQEKCDALDEAMAAASTEYSKLSELSREKEETEAKLEERMERFLELQELVESFAKES